MDYTELAHEFLENMKDFRKARRHKTINDSMQGESFVLHYIYHKGRDIQPGEISSEMGVSSARVASALGSLEKKHLITREIDPSDRRKILVSLTPEGQAEAKQHKLAVLQDTIEMFKLLGEADAREYVRITKRLAALARQDKE